jgi:quercetin dioxygenase-like cupin family protein
MTMTVALTITFALAVAQGAHGAMAADESHSQTVSRIGAKPDVKGPEKCFTGNVRISPLFSAKHPTAPFGGAYVTFEPGARTFWHTHPTGQHLIVVSGIGRTGTWRGKTEEVKAGDVVWCPPGVKHWHGASPTTAMTHLALTGSLPDGKNVEWLEPVTDDQYAGKE